MNKMMTDFYAKSDDPDVNLAKKAFQGNAIQSVMDNQMAMQLGQFNAGLAQSNMTHQADLEQRNAAALMKDEFNYGMQSMEAQAKLQNEAANAQHTRDLGMTAAQGEQQRKNITSTGQQDRLGTIVAGEQDRMKQEMVNKTTEKVAEGRVSSEKYQSDKAAEASMYGADKQTEASKFSSITDRQKAENVATTQAEASKAVATTGAEADKAVAATAADASKYGADKQLEGVKDTNTTSTTNIKETGNQSRLTQDNETRNKAKDRANMHQYARSTARAY